MLTDVRRVIQRLVRRNHVRSEPSARLPGEPALPLVPIPATYQEAARGLVDRQTVESLPYRKAVIRVSREGLDPEIRDFLAALLLDLSKRGMPFVFVSGRRTEAEQQALFEKGVTRARAGESPHNFGLAVDIVHFKRGWDLTSREWAIVGLIGKEVARRRKLKVEWGGDFSFYDPAHWQRANWREFKLPRSDF